MIQILPQGAVDLSEINKNRIFDLMVRAYAITEEDIWGENYVRVPREEYFRLLENETFFIALEGDQLIGSIQVYRKSDTLFGLGLLNIDFEHKGRNIGSLLVSAAEDYARQNGGKCMQIEILRPEISDSAYKKWLEEWYEKLNYRFIETVPFEAIETEQSHKKKKIKTNAVFDIFHKTLSP